MRVQVSRSADFASMLSVHNVVKWGEEASGSRQDDCCMPELSYHCLGTLTKVISAGSNTIEEGFKIHCRQTVSESCTQEKCGSGGEKPYQTDSPWKGQI